jgi:RES domain-containing protein
MANPRLFLDSPVGRFQEAAMAKRFSLMVLWRVMPLAPGERMERASPATARWHRGEKPVVYAARSPELALVEALVHLKADFEPHALVRLELRDVRVAQVPLSALPAGWKSKKSITRDIGDAWLSRGRTELLAVPSAPCPEAMNLLVACHRLEPRQLRVRRIRGFRFDSRLIDGAGGKK